MLKSKAYLFSVLFTLFVYNGLLNIQPRHANDFPYVTNFSLLENFDIPRLWSPESSDLGEYVISTLWSWPLDVLYGLGAKLGFSFVILDRIFGVIPIILIGTYSIGKLLGYLKIGSWGVYTGSLFYLLSTYVILIIDGGQLSIGLAYAWFPLSYLLITKAVDGKWWYKILSGVSVVVLGFFDPRFIYILGILLLMHFVVYGILENKENLLKWFWGWIITGLTVILFYACLNIYWILPSILVKAPMLPQGYTQVGQTSFLGFTTWKHAFLLLQPQWFKNVFGVVPSINYAFLLIPLLAFLSPILVILSKLKGKFTSFVPKIENRKEIVFWTAVALIGIFLTKGSNPPAGFVYNFLFTNVPGFSLFRDSTKFFFFIALSYSVLIAFSVDWLTKRFKYSITIKHFSLNIIPLIITAYFIILVSPVWTGKMTGMFSKPVYERESLSVSEKIENDDSFSRTFFIPSRAPLGYTSPTHPSVEALRMVAKRPFAIGTVGKYEQFNFLREAPFMGELFAVAGIKYIYYPYPDTRRETLKQDNIDYYYSFLDQLNNMSWVDSKISEPPIGVLQTKKTKDHIFLADNSYYVVGSDRIYWDLMNIDDFDLSNNALLFADEKAGLLNNIDTASGLLVYDKGETDLFMSFVNEKNLYFPANALERDPTEDQKWWKRQTSDLVWWKDFLQAKYDLYNLDFDYGGGWAVAEGNLQLSISYDKFLKGNNLYARAMKSNRSGKVEFWQGKEKIGEIVTQERDPETVAVKLTGYEEIPDQISEFNKADMNWYEIGEMVSEEPITIKTFGEINVINALASVTDDEGVRLESKVKELSDNGRILVWGELTDTQKHEMFSNTNENSLNYKRINPTEYEIEIPNLKDPSFLVFSETYDELWELSGQKSKQVYSLLNGFYVDKPGIYTLFFTPQKYVLSGLVISGTSFLVLVSLVIYLKLKKKI